MADDWVRQLGAAALMALPAEDLARCRRTIAEVGAVSIAEVVLQQEERQILVMVGAPGGGEQGDEEPDQDDQDERDHAGSSSDGRECIRPRAWRS